MSDRQVTASRQTKGYEAMTTTTTKGNEATNILYVYDMVDCSFISYTHSHKTVKGMARTSGQLHFVVHINYMDLVEKINV